MDKQLAQQVLTAILGQESLENAMGVFHMAVDKEIAQMAAYKSLGLDPRDIQRFGWLQMLGAKEGSVNVTQTTGGAPTPVPLTAPVNHGWLKPALIGGILTGAVLLAGMAARPVVMPAVQKAGAWDAVIEELQPDGVWKEISREHLK